MKLKTLHSHDWLDIAQEYANRTSGCRKVAVGSVIVQDGQPLALGANRGIPDLCKTERGCLRMERFGDDSKAHRDPADCRAIHSEVDAIGYAARQGIRIDGATIYVTRYPCESCAKAIIVSGIKTVYYGGTAEASEDTKHMLETYGVDLIWLKNYGGESNDH